MNSVREVYPFFDNNWIISFLGGEMTLITIVIPLFNKAPYITGAINSIQRQTFQDFQIIVVNDGSTDGGEHIVK
ncbi:MAG: glycosyltransferase, partial [Leadbetterella sp.]|nr:glycosyltransferase [Leadbetterella sp.]